MIIIKYRKYIVLILLMLSILLNGYFMTNVPEPVIQTIETITEVEKVVSVTKVVIKYETQIVTSSIVTSSIDKIDGYDILVSSQLKIFTNPLSIVEDKVGKLYIPETLTGNAQLSTLKWDITVNLNPSMEYSKKTLPIDIGFGLGGLKPEIGVCIDIPLIDADIMLGFRGFNIGSVTPINKRTAFRAGIGMDYKQRVFTFIGLKTNIF